MEFNRRDFLKGTIAVGSMAALGGIMAGCSQPAAQTPAEGEGEAASAIKPPRGFHRWQMGWKGYGPQGLSVCRGDYCGF